MNSVPEKLYIFLKPLYFGFGLIVCIFLRTLRYFQLYLLLTIVGIQNDANFIKYKVAYLFLFS